jgi:hypothetical protein
MRSHRPRSATVISAMGQGYARIIRAHPLPAKPRDQAEGWSRTRQERSESRGSRHRETLAKPAQSGECCSEGPEFVLKSLVIVGAQKPQSESNVFLIDGNELEDHSSETSNGKCWRMKGVKEIKPSSKENRLANHCLPESSVCDLTKTARFPHR